MRIGRRGCADEYDRPRNAQEQGLMLPQAHHSLDVLEGLRNMFQGSACLGEWSCMLQQ